MSIQHYFLPLSPLVSQTITKDYRLQLFAYWLWGLGALTHLKWVCFFFLVFFLFFFQFCHCDIAWNWTEWDLIYATSIIVFWVFWGMPQGISTPLLTFWNSASCAELEKCMISNFDLLFLSNTLFSFSIKLLFIRAHFLGKSSEMSVLVYRLQCLPFAHYNFCHAQCPHTHIHFVVQ